MKSEDFELLKTAIESRIKKEINELKKLYQAKWMVKMLHFFIKYVITFLTL